MQKATCNDDLQIAGQVHESLELLFYYLLCNNFFFPQQLHKGYCVGLLWMNCEYILAEVKVTSVYRYFKEWAEALAHNRGF